MTTEECINNALAEKYLRNAFAALNPAILATMRAKNDAKFTAAADQYEGIVMPHIDLNIVPNLSPILASLVVAMIAEDRRRK